MVKPTDNALKRTQSPLGVVLVFLLSGMLSPSTAAKGMEDLLSVYERARLVLNDPDRTDPFYLQADVKNYLQSGEAALYFETSLSEIAESLGELSNWCSILLLHLNTKACTYNESEDEKELTLYVGRKFYQEPDDAFVMTYRFETERSKDYFSALITADEGPLGTSDYRIQLEVASIDGKTFGRIQVSQEHSWLSSRAAKLYVATKGRDKLGISVVGHDDQGNPIYSSGERGIAERNLLRYFFAFAAFFRTKGNPKGERFSDSLNDWFSQTEQYEQLYEVDRPQYITDKNKELANQIALQNSVYVDRETARNR